MEEPGRIIRAAAYAAEKHTGQKRKGRDGEPYINHPLEVADLLINVGNVTDEDSVVAALLHDVVEDTDITFDDIAREFGSTVAGYVRELTDDKSLPKAERKRLQVEHAPHLSHAAKQIKLCDKISNIQDVTENPPEGWDVQRRREYVEWGERVAAGLRGSNPELEKLFDETVAEARRKIATTVTAN